MRIPDLSCHVVDARPGDSHGSDVGRADAIVRQRRTRAIFVTRPCRQWIGPRDAGGEWN